MSTIQTARYEQFTRRLLRIVGGSVMPRLQNDLSPVINIEDPSDDALLFWRGHRLASGTTSGTADALEFAECSLFNPLGSEKLVVLLGVRFSLSGATGLQANLTQTRTLVPSALSFFNDTRAAGTTRPTAEVGFSSLAALPTNISFTWWAGANGQDSTFPSWVLSPGFGIAITHQVAAAFLGVSWYWLERSAELSEIQGA